MSSTDAASTTTAGCETIFPNQLVTVGCAAVASILRLFYTEIGWAEVLFDHSVQINIGLHLLRATVPHQAGEQAYAEGTRAWATLESAGGERMPFRQ